MPIGKYQRASADATRVRLQELRAAQALTLEKKCDFTKSIIARGLERGRPATLYSGGRDSTVVLEFVADMAPGSLVVFNNTTLGDARHVEFLREWVASKPVEFVETTAEDPHKFWRDTGHWPLLGKRTFTAAKKAIPGFRASPVQCCYGLKAKYANQVFRDREIAVVMWGNRALESMRRRLTWVDSGYLFKPKRGPWWQCYPIAHWSERDVRQFLKKRAPDFPRLSSTESGCVVCGTDLAHFPNNLSRLFQSDFARWRELMLGGMGEQIARLNGLNVERLREIVDERPELLLKRRPLAQLKRKGLVNV